MKENTRRELVKRLTVIAAASGGVYVAPKVTIIKTAWAHHKPGHTGGPGCSQPPCNGG